MVGFPEILAIVQARGGSKGIPRKNLSLLRGHPLVAYSIVSGLAAETVSRLIVSTDDPQIAEVSRYYGAEVPFLRPAELATDDATDLPLFEHALKWFDEQEDYRPDIVVQLRPTTPLRPCGMIDAAVRCLMEDPGADCVRGVTRPNQNPYKMWQMAEEGYLTPLVSSNFEEPYNMPRQKLPATFWQTGHIDVIRYETIVNQRSLTGSRIRPISIDNRYCVDIDTPDNLDMANRRLELGQLDIDLPRDVKRRAWPAKIELLVLDFDGVFTDNRVWVLEDGREAVACHRGDGLGLAQLQSTGLKTVVLSTEKNPVVTARCKKLDLLCMQAIEDKGRALKILANEKQIKIDNIVYVGNDTNDLCAMREAGYAVAVADAHPTALAAADLVLNTPGGHGAIRELCDLLTKKLGDQSGKNS